MSEKRFTLYYERGNEAVFKDNGKMIANTEVVDLLNEQQATIEKLKWAVDVKQKYIEKLEKRLEE